jgi:hypothetical protein
MAVGALTAGALVATGAAGAAGAAGACVASGADVPQATSTNKDIPMEMNNIPLGRKSFRVSIMVPIVTSLFFRLLLEAP